jgi:hypothetical protein
MLEQKAQRRLSRGSGLARLLRKVQPPNPKRAGRRTERASCPRAWAARGLGLASMPDERQSLACEARRSGKREEPLAAGGLEHLVGSVSCSAVVPAVDIVRAATSTGCTASPGARRSRHPGVCVRAEDAPDALVGMRGGGALAIAAAAQCPWVCLPQLFARIYPDRAHRTSSPPSMGQ